MNSGNENWHQFHLLCSYAIQYKMGHVPDDVTVGIVEHFLLSVRESSLKGIQVTNIEFFRLCFPGFLKGGLAQTGKLYAFKSV